MTTRIAISAEQASAEDHFARQLDAKDANTLLDFATYVEERISTEQVRDLLLAILDTNDHRLGFILAEIATNSRPMRAALDDWHRTIESHKAGFMTFAAKGLLGELKGEEA